MPGTVLDAEDTGMNKRDDILCPPQAGSWYSSGAR